MPNSLHSNHSSSSTKIASELIFSLLDMSNNALLLVISMVPKELFMGGFQKA